MSGLNFGPCGVVSDYCGPITTVLTVEKVSAGTEFALWSLCSSCLHISLEILTSRLTGSRVETLAEIFLR